MPASDWYEKRWGGVGPAPLPDYSLAACSSSVIHFIAASSSSPDIYPPPPEPEPEPEFCLYCHGKFIEDERGNCSACGAPCVEPEEEESKWGSVSVQLGDETYYLAIGMDDLDASETQKMDLAENYIQQQVTRDYIEGATGSFETTYEPAPKNHKWSWKDSAALGVFFLALVYIILVVLAVAL